MKPRYYTSRWPKVERVLRKEWLAAKQAILRHVKQPITTNMSGV